MANIIAENGIRQFEPLRFQFNFAKPRASFRFKSLGETDMNETVETKFGLRHKNGKFAKIRMDQGTETYWLTMDGADHPVFQTPEAHDILRLKHIEIHEWGTSAEAPSNRNLWKNIHDFEIVAFRIKKTFDIVGGDPVKTSETVERPKFTFIKGREPDGWMFDTKLTPHLEKFTAHFEFYKNVDSDRAPFLDICYLETSGDTPKPGNFFIHRHGNILEIVSAKPLANPMGGPTFALLTNANPNFLNDIEMEPYLETDAPFQYNDEGYRL